MFSNYLVANVQADRMIYPRSDFQDGDWAIVSCRVTEVIEGEPYNDKICIKGNIFGYRSGVVYRLEGSLVNDEKYGYSYNILTMGQQADLGDTDQQKAYLRAVCSERQIDALYQALPDPFETLKRKDVDAICMAKGFGFKTASKLIERFTQNLNNAKVYAVLSKYGLTPACISSLIKRFNSPEACIKAVEDNPYLMIDTVEGIGWKRADEIALAKGMPRDSKERIKAFINYHMAQEADQGHTYTTPLNLINETFVELGISNQDTFREVLHEMHDKGELWWDDSQLRVALGWIRNIEVEIAHQLWRISSATPSTQYNKYDNSILEEIEVAQGWQFTEEQHDAIQKTLSNNVIVITGQAGTGKSSVVGGALKVLKDSYMINSDEDYAQCALSGRAAARLTEVTGTQGMTIHRLLGYTYGEFTYNELNPLPQKVIILDEISMVGAEIFLSLLKAIPSGSKLIMLGDDGQLESIGLCNLMNDILKSGVIPVIKLTKIHRQAARSAIITESGKVREQVQLADVGWVGEEVRGELQDFKLRVFDNSLVTQPTIIQEYQNLLSQGISPHEIQVVVAMKQKGDTCTLVLNKIIQGMVNPCKNGIKIGKGARAVNMSVGDRVIITHNTYDSVCTNNYLEPTEQICPVYNGDRGIIKELSTDHMVVCFDLWGDIYLSRSQMVHVELGYALTCHKLQGSEAPYVIIGVDGSAHMLLTKEWLYTAITRAKKYCVLCAQAHALRYAISTSNVPIKRTMLQELLQETFKEANDERSNA